MGKCEQRPRVEGYLRCVLRYVNVIKVPSLHWVSPHIQVCEPACTSINLLFATGAVGDAAAGAAVDVGVSGLVGRFSRLAETAHRSCVHSRRCHSE